MGVAWTTVVREPLSMVDIPNWGPFVSVLLLSGVHNKIGLSNHYAYDHYAYDTTERIA